MTLPPNTCLEAAKIFLVEDNLNNQLIVDMCLRDVCEAFAYRPTGAQALGYLAAHPNFRPDIILLDIQLPGDDGFHVLKFIKERPYLKNTKVIALTAYSDPDNVARARRDGFDGFIAKPISEERFLSQLETILAGGEVWG